MEHARYRRSQRAVGAMVAGEVTLLDTEAGVYFGLEGVGAEVWAMLEGPQTLGEIVERLLERYEVGPEQCREETTDLLASLTSRGLVEVVSG